jgi:hypothetical protein
MHACGGQDLAGGRRILISPSTFDSAYMDCCFTRDAHMSFAIHRNIHLNLLPYPDRINLGLTLG